MPLTIFAHKENAGAIRKLLADNQFAIEGSDSKWLASRVFKKGLFKKLKLKLTYDIDYCSPPNWPQQISGMQNFISNFPMEPDMQEKVMAMISSFRLSIGTIAEPEIESTADPRFEILHTVAAELDAIFFSPGALLDRHLLTLIDAAGNTNQEARFPDFPAVELPTYDDEEDDEEFEPNPPEAHRVVRRMYCLAAVAARGLADMNLAQNVQPAYSHENLLNWVAELGLDDELEPEEKIVIETPARGLGQQQLLDSVWRFEGVAVLAWALGLYPLPPYDEVVEVDKILQKIGFQLDSSIAKENIENATLVSPNSLSIYNGQILAYHWRMVDFRVRPEKIDYAAMAEKCWFGKFDLSWARLIDDDLVIQGQPISSAGGEDVGSASSIAAERHIASNWLMGYSKIYSETDAST